MFNYPIYSAKPGAPNGIPEEDAPAVKLDPAKVAAAREKADKEKAAELKAELDEIHKKPEEAKALAQIHSRDATGSADYGAHAVLDDALHADRM